MAFLEFRGVSKVYPPGVVALDNVTLSIGKGEFVFLQGATGAGKTTLFRLITREEQPTKGEIWFSGRRVDLLDARFVPFLRQRLGVVFQELELVPEWTVYEHLMMPLRVLGVDGKEAVQAAKKMLTLLELEGKGFFRVSCLSGGEKQKLCVGRALIHKPKLVLADEPTGNLDEVSARKVLELLFAFSQEEGATVIVATHNRALTTYFPARVVVLERGRIREER